MKKFTLYALSVLLVGTTNAQFTKGEKYLSGFFSGSLQENDLNDNNGVESFNLFLSPSFHKFKTDKKASGFKILIGFNQFIYYNSPTITRQRMGTVGAGLFSQNYVNLNKDFYLVLEKGFSGAISFGNNKTLTVPTSSYDLTSYNVNLYLTPGIGYKLTDRLIIGLNFSNALSLSYTHSVTEYPSGKSRTDALNFLSSLNNTSLGSVGINFGWRLK
jgi:hypothetical protein